MKKKIYDIYRQGLGLKEKKNKKFFIVAAKMRVQVPSAT
jgi:hypothetical protein